MRHVLIDDVGVARCYLCFERVLLLAYIPGIMYQVPGTGCRVQTDVVYMWSLVFCGLRIIYHIIRKKKKVFFFLIRSIRNYTCLHEFQNEVTNRRGKKTPFFNLKKKSIRNGLKAKFLVLLL